MFVKNDTPETPGPLIVERGLGRDELNRCELQNARRRTPTGERRGGNDG